MKTINNLNTLNALIRDERKASHEYGMLSRDKSIPVDMREQLLKMSEDERRHSQNLMHYREYLKKERRK